MRFHLLLTAVLSALAASVATFAVTRYGPDGDAHAAAAIAPSVDRDQQPGAIAAPPVQTGTLTPEPGIGSSAVAEQAREDERTKRELDALARAFRSEPVDAAWSASTERHLSQTMASDIMIATEIVPEELELDCRSSLCVVKARFGKYNDASDWGMMLVTAAGQTFGKAMPVVTPGADGRAYLEMYAQRR